MSKEQRPSGKLLESKSFDTHKNATAPMIAMLDCSEIDAEISNTGVETADFNDYREISRDDGDANGMLAITREGARFSCKDG